MTPFFHRRGFIRRGAALLGGLTGHSLLAAETSQKPPLRIGLVTDLHYGEKPEQIGRFYRESLGKLEEAVARFNQDGPSFVVELGDLIDKAETPAQEISWLEKIESVFARIKAPRHYVLGNHCVATLSKAEFAAHTAARTPHHYSYNVDGWHFVTLDGCYTQEGAAYERGNFDWKDSNLPAAELAWLREDLAGSKAPTIVFAHQRLDEKGPHSLRNAAAVREVLETSRRVVAVFQGHSHANDYQQIAGIHYCTLVAMVEGSGAENSGYALLDLMGDGSIHVHGFRRQVNYTFANGNGIPAPIS